MACQSEHKETQGVAASDNELCDFQGKSGVVFTTSLLEAYRWARTWGAERALTVGPGCPGDHAQDKPRNGSSLSHPSRAAYTVRMTPPPVR